MPKDLTSMEWASIKVFYDLYGEQFKFPHPDQLSVTKREQNNTYRYVYFDGDYKLSFNNSAAIMGVISHIELENNKNGLFVELSVEDGKIEHLAFVAYTDWDGDESGFRIICD